MTKYRQAAKIDDNQRSIVSALRKLGYTVEVGHDDILVGHGGRTFWFEVKSPSVANKCGQVFESAKKDHQIWLENNWPGHYRIVTTLEEILEDLCKKIPDTGPGKGSQGEE